MEFLVVIDNKSLFGDHLLRLLRKVGGASSVHVHDGDEHPVIVATDLRLEAGFVRMTHLEDPGREDQRPKQVVVPAEALLLALEHSTGTQQRAEQHSPPSVMH